MNIVLIGYRGTGKSAVARQLRERLGWDILDTDHLVEMQAGTDIDALVRQKGWAHFRALESEAVAEAAAQDKAIIATGGGAVLQPGNAEKLKKTGVFVLLTEDVAVIKQRLAAGRKRPALSGKDAVSEVEAVLKERMPIYTMLADIVIDRTSKDITATADIILRELKKRKAI